MTTQRFSLEHIQQLSLAEFILPEQVTAKLPCFVSFEKNSWQVSEQLITFTGTSEKIAAPQTTQSAIELIVFSDITIGLLSELIAHCNLSLPWVCFLYS